MYARIPQQEAQINESTLNCNSRENNKLLQKLEIAPATSNHNLAARAKDYSVNASKNILPQTP